MSVFMWWQPPGKHFLTAHSWVGAAGLATCALNGLWGSVKSARLLRWPQFTWVDAGHRALGTFSFVVFCCACFLGLYNKVSKCHRVSALLLFCFHY